MNRLMKLTSALLVHPASGKAEAEELLPGQVAAMSRGKGKRLYCTSGRLWVTLEHGHGDLILEADQCLDIDENGRVVISALDRGSYKVA